MLQKIPKMIKIILFKIDLFSSAQLLRIKTETGYSTLTGGVLSLILIISFSTLLIQNSIQVLTYSDVNAIDSLSYSEDPTYTSFTFDERSPFIFGVGITGINLTAGERYFDVILSAPYYAYGRKVNEPLFQLQPCQYDQWAHINSIGAHSFNSTGFSQFYCPPKGMKVEMQGKFTSEIFKYLRIKVGKCKDQTDPSRPCKDPTIVNQANAYTLNFYFMNAYVNSGGQQPVNYYLEDRNYFGFTLNTSVAANIYMTQQTIQTDNSLLPWKETEQRTVLLVDQLAEFKPYQNSPASSDVYISVYLRKSPYSKHSQRSFTKLLDLFSSIGGLFGFCVTFFLFVQQYTQVAYQIEMGESLFYYDPSEPIQSKSFNFFYFLTLCLYELVKKFDIEIPWKKMKRFHQCRSQVLKQLDLSLLMNKTTFLEKCMNALFQQHQFRAIYLQQKPNVIQAQNLRRNHGLNKIIHHHSRKINNKIRLQMKKQKSKFIKNMLEIPKTDSIIMDRIVRQSEVNEVESRMKQVQSSSQNKIPYDLLQVVANFIMSHKARQPSMKSITEKKSINSEDIQLEQVAEQNAESLKFINTALNDIKIVEQQSKNGNTISNRIYRQLNNDITKQQFIVMKCLQNIMAKRSNESQQEKKEQGKGSQQQTIFDRIIKMASSNHSNDEKNHGLEIVLESNNRIITNQDL